MQKAFLFVASLALLLALANAAWIETVRTGTLSANQVVPATNGAPGYGGTFVCVLDRNSSPKTMDCEVQTDVDDVAEIQLYSGARGENGPLLYTFDNQFQAGYHLRQTFDLVDFNGYTVDQQITDFLNGHWYMTIGSDDFQGSIIRGQIEHIDRSYARMAVQNTIPRASGTSASGISLGTFTFYDPARTFQVDFVHNVIEPTGVEIREGIPGTVGPLIYCFIDASSSVFHSVEYTIIEERELLADLQYIQILSENNPNGEIRGQLIAIDYIPNIAFTARLSGGEEVPDVSTSSKGCGIVAYNCETRVLEYLVQHNVANPTGAFIHAAERGDNGAALFSLSNHVSPIYGAVQLTLEEELFLYTQQLYFNVVSNEFPNGEIRGQIGIDADWWAYLSGTNIIPPVTTEAVGCATFFLEGDQNRILNYAVHHSVVSPRKVTLQAGEEGQNGPEIFSLPSVFSPIRGDSVVFDDDDLEAFVTNNMYVSVESETYPVLGEIRGQIRRIDPCRSTHDNTLTFSISGVDGGAVVETSQFQTPGSPTSVSPQTASGSPVSPASPFSPLRIGRTSFSTRDTFSRRFIPPSSFGTSVNNNNSSSTGANLQVPIYFTAFLATLMVVFLAKF